MQPVLISVEIDQENEKPSRKPFHIFDVICLEQFANVMPTSGLCQGLYLPRRDFQDETVCQLPICIVFWQDE